MEIDTDIKMDMNMTTNKHMASNMNMYKGAGHLHYIKMSVTMKMAGT
jgi:hypothetical protein